MENLGLPVRACLGIYIVLSMVYTASNLWLIILGPATIASPIDLFLHSRAPSNTLPKQSGISDAGYLNISALQVEEFLSSKHFSSSLINRNSTISEDVFLSKAFPRLMQPIKIIPFYYKSSRAFKTPEELEDITITTLVTSDRFPVFKQLVELYQGPISVTIHVPLSSLNILAELHALYTSSAHFRSYVDVHLVLSPFHNSEGSRQFNAWRNLARLFARTQFVMMLDVDFVPCTPFRAFIRRALQENTAVENKDFLDKFRNGTAALIVPAFEYVKQKDGTNQKSFPSDKAGLLRLIKTKPPTIASFHASWAPGHSSTDYARYYEIPSNSGEVYKVTQYQSAYEPYVIFNNHVPWCEERFTGYGANKAACLFEMYLSAMDYYVLADHFLIHQSHKYEEQARKEERRYNRKLYHDFKEEVCLRYIQRFWDQGILHTHKAANARNECIKIKGIAKLTAQMIDEYVTRTVTHGA